MKLRARAHFFWGGGGWFENRYFSLAEVGKMEALCLPIQHLLDRAEFR